MSDATGADPDDRRPRQPARAPGCSASGSTSSTRAAEADRRAAYVFVMGSLARAAAHLRLPARVPRDQLAADRRAARGARVPRTRPRTTATRPTSAATSRPTSPRSCAGGELPDGPHPEAGARRAHQRLQHLHQVGARSGSACTGSRSSRSTCPARAAGGASPARAAATSSNDRRYVGGPAARADHAAASR